MRLGEPVDTPVFGRWELSDTPPPGRVLHGPPHLCLDNWISGISMVYGSQSSQVNALGKRSPIAKRIRPPPVPPASTMRRMGLPGPWGVAISTRPVPVPDKHIGHHKGAPTPRFYFYMNNGASLRSAGGTPALPVSVDRTCVFVCVFLKGH